MSIAEPRPPSWYSLPCPFRVRPCLLAVALTSLVACGSSQGQAITAGNPPPPPPPPLVPPSVPCSALAEDVWVLHWKDGAQAALTLTFDDGQASQPLHAAPILQTHGIPATFNLITGSLGTSAWFGTWAQFEALQSAGHELASHTVTHPDLTQIPEGAQNQPGSQRYELAQSKASIESKGQPCVSFAYPFSAADAPLAALVGAHYLSARSGGVDGASPRWNSALDPDWNRLASYTPVFPASRSALSADDAEQLRTRTVLQAATTQKAWALLMIHAVVPFEQLAAQGGYETQTTSWLDSLCGWIASQRQAGAFWTDTQGRVMRYIRERNAAKLKLTRTATRIDLELSDGLEDALFDQPLTLEIALPSAWNRVRIVNQDGTETRLDSRPASSRVRVSVIPDRGPIRLLQP